MYTISSFYKSRASKDGRSGSFSCSYFTSIAGTLLAMLFITSMLKAQPACPSDIDPTYGNPGYQAWTSYGPIPITVSSGCGCLLLRKTPDQLAHYRPEYMAIGSY